MSKNKTVNKILLVITLACVGITGATLALLSQVTQTATNVFASSRSISIALREPAWDGYTFDDTLPSKPGEFKNPNVVDKKGIDYASQYVPGDIIDKNPMIKNTSLEGVYVAIKVQYMDDEGNAITKTQFHETYGKTKFGQGEFNKDFTSIHSGNDGEVFIWKDVLNPGETTEELFQSVVINSDVVPSENGKLPTFKVKVTGYSVQGTGNVSKDQATQALLNMAK